MRTLLRRELNRALLARQHLLRRADLPVLDMVEHLVGLQAQAVPPPYFGLWSRLDPFDRDEVGRLLEQRKLVRMWLMRGTVHLVSLRDGLFLRPLTAIAGQRGHQGAFGRRMGDADLGELVEAARELLESEPRGALDLGRQLVADGQGADPHAIGNAARAYVPLVQVTPRGIWGAGGQAKLTTIEAWTARSLHRRPSPAKLILRYLAAFGPATVLDVQNWSGLTRLRPVVEGLRPRLVTFRDEDGKELFDLPDAPRPDPEVEAPVRFLGEFDNVLLGHADRRRIIPEDFPWASMLSFGRFVNNVLVDGELRATWWIEADRTRATLGIRPFGKLARGVRGAVEAEAQRMAEFAAPEAETRDVRFEDPVG